MSKHDSTKTDFSSFMCIILMLTGALVTILIANVVVIAANPENIQITTIAPGDLDGGAGAAPELDEFGNYKKNPWYLEVSRDHLVIHPGGEIVNIKDLESKDNGFERLLAQVKKNEDKQYVVLLVRPYAAHIARQLKRTILDRKIDIGIDLLNKDQKVNLMNSATNIARGASAPKA